jgi:hypothetical protein
MNYRIILRDTLRLFQKSKLIWFLGAISFVSELFVYGVPSAIRNNPTFACSYFVFFAFLYLVYISKCSLIYAANQILSEQNPTFSDAWNFSKTKLKTIGGLYFLSIPLVMFAVLIVALFAWSGLDPVVAQFVNLVVTSFLTSLFTLSICTIVIHNLDSAIALWTGLLIVFNNFFPVVILNGIFLFIEVGVSFLTGNVFLSIFLYIPLTVTMTVVYRALIAKGSYPSLSNTQFTA